MADIGNPNFFKIFKGKYEITLPDGTKKHAMLSCTNDVILMAHLTSDANSLLATIPNELTPVRNLLFPCFILGGTQLGYILIDTTGKIRADQPNKTYFTEGFSYNISSKFYG